MIFLLLACTSGEDSATCTREPALDWDNFGHPLMNQYCTGCHASTWPEEKREGAPLGIDFDTYAGVLAYADQIATTAVPDDASMPPGGGPTADERALLGEWLSCGVAADRAELDAE